MILQRCGSCNYGGDSIVHMYNTSLGQVTRQCGYAMVAVTDISGQQAYAAVRSAYGGDTISQSCSGDSCKNSPTELKPNDTWAPLILLTGRVSEYRSFANFSAAVCGAHLEVDPSHQGGQVALAWRGHFYNFTSNNRTGQYRLPTKDGQPVDISPPWQYKGPHLNGALLSDTVTLRYTNDYVLEYQFVDNADAIVRTTSSVSKTDDYDGIITAAHNRAEANRVARIESWNAYDFTPNQACGECTAASCENWTLCGFGGVAAAIGVMFSGRNASAMNASNAFIVNMTLNFVQNGFVPAPTTNCSNVISTLCGATRNSLGACEACAGLHLHELNAAKCTQTEVSAFCAVPPGPPPTRQACFDQCLHRVGPAASFARCVWHMPLERSHLARAFALFDASSRFVKDNGGTLPAWGPAAQQALREFFIAQTQANLFALNETVYLSNPRNMFGSENIDSSQQVRILFQHLLGILREDKMGWLTSGAMGQVTTYLALDVLAQINRSLTFADGDSVITHLARWENYMYGWIKHKATAGLFSELGSTGYWSRTWPNLFNLVDLPTSERIRRRAKMYVDVAMAEAEQSSIAGVRAGSKSRAKVIQKKAPSDPSL